jgi:sulfonate transport system permease protein
MSLDARVSDPIDHLQPGERATGRFSRDRSVLRGGRRLIGPVLLLVVWQIASTTGLVDGQTLASPLAVAHAASRLIADGQLAEHLAVSLRRAALGLTFGVAAGLCLAILSGLFRLGEDLIDSTMQILRSLPILVAMGTAFPIYINTHAAIRGIDPRYVDLAKTVGLSRLALVRRVVLPGALPGFFVGLRFSVTIAWLVLVVSEQINAASGIGFLMIQARDFGQTDVIVVGLLVYGCLGLTSNALVRAVERRALRWRPGFQGS